MTTEPNKTNEPMSIKEMPMTPHSFIKRKHPIGHYWPPKKAEVEKWLTEYADHAKNHYRSTLRAEGVPTKDDLTDDEIESIYHSIPDVSAADTMRAGVQWMRDRLAPIIAAKNEQIAELKSEIAGLTDEGNDRFANRLLTLTNKRGLHLVDEGEDIEQLFDKVVNAFHRAAPLSWPGEKEMEEARSAHQLSEFSKGIPTHNKDFTAGWGSALAAVQPVVNKIIPLLEFYLKFDDDSAEFQEGRELLDALRSGVVVDGDAVEFLEWAMLSAYEWFQSSSGGLRWQKYKRRFDENSDDEGLPLFEPAEKEGPELTTAELYEQFKSKKR